MLTARRTAFMIATIAAVAALPTNLASAGDDDRTQREIAAEAGTVSGPTPPAPPPPSCRWTSKSADNDDRVSEQQFWNHIDGGDHADDVIVFIENGSLRRTFSTTQKTYVFQIKVCDDPNDPTAGTPRWALVGPPNPTVYWDELTERVTRQVPVPTADLGFTPDPTTGRIDIVVHLGLWITVTNPNDVVARAQPAPAIWAETRATLHHIEYDTGTGTTITCNGAGTPLPESGSGEQGGCGYTYTTVNELGDHTATIRTIWQVTNTTSNGDTRQRPDIVRETTIPITVYEIQTVGIAP